MSRPQMSRTVAGALPLAAAIASFAAAQHGEALAPARPLGAAPDTGRVRAPAADTIRPAARPAAVPSTPDTGRVRAAGADTARAAAAQEPDAVYEALLRLEGYTPVRYKGKEAQFRADSGVLELRGDAQVERAGEKLTADTIVYEERSKVASAFGDPKVTGQGQDIAGNVLIYDLERRVAAVRGGRTQYASGATWYIQGETVAAMQDSNRVYVENSTFTTDERENPQYHFRAGRTKVVKDRLLVGRPAVLYFRNVPVAWLPFIVQDMEKGRRSGILTPRFGINDVVRTSPGYQRQISNVGYYWAINPYMGAQVSGEWRSNSYTAVLGSLDFNWRRQFLNGNFSSREFFRDGGGRDRTLSGNASWRPDERTDINAQGSYASSSQFVRQRSTDPFEATQDLSSSFSLSRRFDWGQLSLGSQRRQSLGNDRVEWTFPSFGLTPNTVTLFRSGSPELARWYNDVTLTFGAQGSRSGVDFPIDTVRGADGVLRTGQRPETRDNLQVNNSIRVGNLSLTNAASLNRNLLEGLRGIDSVSSFNRDEGQWSSQISYQQNLVGSTFIAPNLSVSQQVRRDTLSRALGRSGYVAAPMRLNFGASLNTDLFGFFPGVGPIERIRHHVRPGLSYTYSPRIQQTAFQDSVFGRANALTQNRIALSLDQTFEGRLRSASRPATQPRDSTADSTAAAPLAPPDARKVTLLAFNITALEYDFERASGVDTISGRILSPGYGRVVPRSWKDGFTTDQISTNVRSDYLQGLNLALAVDLFADARQDVLSGSPQARGGFSPILSSLSTGFSFGQGSAIFRRLGLGGRRNDETMVPGQQLVPGDSTRAPARPNGPNTGTLNPQRAGGGGPWNVALNYALVRQRQPTNFEFVPAPDALNRVSNGNNQTLNATVTFSPTPNWAVNWNTAYDITAGEFGAHRLNLRRDLYRWEANFDFFRTPVGNTSFQFSVHLKDLPDLKVDYSERDIGADRRE